MRPKLVLFGDSITEESFGDGGWGSALAHQFSRTADVMLRGYSGYNTRWARLVVDRAMEGISGDPPVAVMVFFGANDASLADRKCGFQHVPIPEYGQNLRHICAFLKELWASTVVILITPPPVDEDGRLKNLVSACMWLQVIDSICPQAYLFGCPYVDNPTGLPERTNESAGAYAKACVTVAKESGIPVIDLWSRMQKFPGWEKSFLRDGLHFTPHGNKLLLNEVVRTLREHGLSLETLPVDLPLMGDIDLDDPAKSFSN